MPSRALPQRPHIDHLKREAKTLHKAILARDRAALGRAAAAIGHTDALKLSDAQRIIAREYGFPTWHLLSEAVEAAAGRSAALAAFLRVAQEGDADAAMRVLEQQPGLSSLSLHVAAALGDVAAVKRLLVEHPDTVDTKAGEPATTPLVVLCFSPFHDKGASGLLETARVLLAAGADPNATDGRFGVPCLYGVTGYHFAPEIARLLLDHGANPTDGESLHHSAGRGRIEALELLLGAGADLNAVGEWGNTPLFFLVHWYNVENGAPAIGFDWLLAQGADPNVRCGKDQETCLHAAARRGRSRHTIARLLTHGADIMARRADGMTAWRLARRAGLDDVAAFLEERGATAESLSDAEELLAACGRGDVDAASRLTSAGALGGLSPDDFALLPDAASRSDERVVAACLAAGFPAATVDAQGATALHHAAMRARPAIARMLIDAGAPLDLRDPQHRAPPLGWATWGADFIRDAQGEYERVIQLLLDAGARLTKHDHIPEHTGVRRVIADHQGIPS
jgi:ankyrin repeat protein